MVDELASRNVRSITVADTLHYVSAGEWHVHKVAEDPLVTAESFKKAGSVWLHMVDLDGAKDGTPVNFDAIKEAAKKLVEIL